MTQVLHYGRSSTLALEIPEGALWADGTGAAITALDDPAAAMAAALAQPLGYPPLARAVVPGDRVVISVEPGIPQAACVVTGVVRTLLSAGVAAADIAVLTLGGSDADESLASRVTAASGEVTAVVHDPSDQAGLCYLAATKDAAPIYLNRHLCDADLIVPINLLRPRAAWGNGGLHGGLFPTFSDAAARERFRLPHTGQHAVEQQRRRDEAAEVAWLLGVQLMVQVIAGRGDSVHHVLAGLLPEMVDQGVALADAAWSQPVPGKAALVVAAIAGDEHEQTWENFGRALHAASEVCAENGTIVLCTALKRPLGTALKRLAHSADDERLWQRLQHDRSEDAMSALLLLENRQRQHIYLLSKLDESTVEALGVGHIGAVDEISHLSRHAESCILLADAHRAVPRVADA